MPRRCSSSPGSIAEEREAADKLQHLIHAKLRHRIKNMLATVGVITDQSLRTATSMACQLGDRRAVRGAGAGPRPAHPGELGKRLDR